MLYYPYMSLMVAGRRTNTLLAFSRKPSLTDVKASSKVTWAGSQVGPTTTHQKNKKQKSRPYD